MPIEDPEFEICGQSEGQGLGEPPITPPTTPTGPTLPTTQSETASLAISMVAAVDSGYISLDTCLSDGNLPPPESLIDPDGDFPEFDPQFISWDGTEIVYTGLTPGLYVLRYVYTGDREQDVFKAREKLNFEFVDPDDPDSPANVVVPNELLNVRTTGIPANLAFPAANGADHIHRSGVYMRLQNLVDDGTFNTRIDGAARIGSFICGHLLTRTDVLSPTQIASLGPVGCGSGVDSCPDPDNQSCGLSGDDDNAADEAISATINMGDLIVLGQFEENPVTVRFKAVSEEDESYFWGGGITVQLFKIGNFIKDQQGNFLPYRVRIKNYATLVKPLFEAAVNADSTCADAVGMIPEWDGTFPVPFSTAPYYLPSAPQVPRLKLGNKMLLTWDTPTGTLNSIVAFYGQVGFGIWDIRIWMVSTSPRIGAYSATYGFRTLWEGRKYLGTSPKGTYTRRFPGQFNSNTLGPGYGGDIAGDLPATICIEAY